MANIRQMLVAAAENDIDTVRQLIARDPALVRGRGPHPYWGGEPNALEVAIEWGNLDVICALLDAGAEPNETSPKYGNWPPLLLAIHRGRLRGHTHIAPYLIERGAHVDLIAAAGLGLLDRLPAFQDVNVRGPNHSTALHWATNVEVVEWLRARGADPDARDQHGNPPERSAAGDRPDVARSLLRAKGTDADIHLAAAMGDVERVGALLDADPTLNARQTYQWDSVANFSGGLPLHIAAIHGRINVARLLIDRGADVNAHCLSGATPLHYTAWKGMVEMAGFLLDHGAQVNALDPQFRATPLGWAEFQRRAALCSFLRQRGGKLGTELGN